VIELRYATVSYTENGCVSWFKDGKFWGAHPHDTHHYAVIAHRCGYGDDLLAYCREHEVCHHLITEWLYDGPSPVIWGLAHGEEMPAYHAALEEMGAQTLQRFIRANERPIIGGVNWDGLKTYALSKLEEA